MKTLSFNSPLALHHKTIALHIKHPPVSLRFTFLEEAVLINANHEGEAADVDIFTSLAAILRMKCQPNKSFVGNGFHVQGDIEVAKAFHALFERYSIDWEEYLSRVTGDVLAHKLGGLFRRKRSFAKTLSHTFVDNVSEYLKEEINVLPSVHAADDFYEAVDELRLSVDRLSARVKRLEKKETHDVQ